MKICSQSSQLILRLYVSGHNIKHQVPNLFKYYIKCRKTPNRFHRAIYYNENKVKEMGQSVTEVSDVGKQFVREVHCKKQISRK